MTQRDHEGVGGHVEILDDWGLWMRAIGMAPGTIALRLRVVGALMRHADLEDPAAVTAMQLAAWLADCRKQWTRCTYWSTASLWCRWLVEQGIRDDNPANRIPRPASPAPKPRPVPMSIVRQVLISPPSLRARAYVVLGAFAGLRVHEIAKVRGEDADRVGGWLHVVGKGQHAASVPMHAFVAALAETMPERGFWFPGKVHGHVGPGTVSTVIQKGLRLHGSTATAHALRHTFGTYMLRVSGDIRVTQEALRHRSLRSTQVYTEVSASDLQAAVRSLDWAAA